MFSLFRPSNRDIKWGAPAHWMVMERPPARSRAAILRDQQERRRWMRDTGIL